MKKEYRYGMRLRPFSPACQPDGWTSVEKGRDGYWNILVYDRPLTAQEIADYELDCIEEK